VTGDNVYGSDCSDSAKSLEAAFASAIASNIPWVAVLGNHDQEGTLSREGVMKHIVGMKNTLSKFNPPEAHVIDGFGNYNLEVGGVEGSDFKINQCSTSTFLIVETIPKCLQFMVMIGSSPPSNFGSNEHLQSLRFCFHFLFHKKITNPPLFQYFQYKPMKVGTKSETMTIFTKQIFYQSTFL